MKHHRTVADGPLGAGAAASFRTVSQVSEMLQVCEQTVRRWLACKKLTSHRFGGTIRIAVGDLTAFLKDARRGDERVVAGRQLEDTFYTADNVAEILNVCIRTVRRRIDAGVLVVHNFDGIIRIARSDLDWFLDRSRRG
jgi:excisionase family DNA binding protein